jgi:sirohydrochlorin cobaltochelatase
MTLARLTFPALAAPAAGLLLALVPSATPLAAQAARTGTIVIAHGGDSTWNAGVREVASQVRTGGPVEVSFLMGAGARTARFQDAVARLEAQQVAEIVVVPLLVSSHSGHYEQVRWLTGAEVALSETMHHHLHMAGITRAATRTPIRLAPALDAAPEMARVLADRALALARARGAEPRDRALLIVGHGPNSAEDYAAWMLNLRAVTDTVRALTGFSDVRVDLVRDDAPAPVRAEAVRRVRELIELQRKATGAEVLVVPVLVSKGSVSRDKVPADIAGTPSSYAPEPLLPHAGIARWIERRVRECGAAARVDSGARAPDALACGGGSR